MSIHVTRRCYRYVANPMDEFKAEKTKNKFQMPEQNRQNAKYWISRSRNDSVNFLGLFSIFKNILELNSNQRQ